MATPYKTLTEETPEEEHNYDSPPPYAQQDANPQGGVPEGSYLQGSVSQGGYPQGGNQQGSYPQGGNPQGGVPEGSYLQGSVSQGGYPQGSVSQGGNQQGRYPQGGNPQGGNPQSPAIQQGPVIQQIPVIQQGPVVQQVQNASTTVESPQGDRPSDYILVSCLVYWFCNCLFGSIAFALSMASMNSADANNYEAAESYGQASMLASTVGIFITIIVVILVVVFYVYSA